MSSTLTALEPLLEPQERLDRLIAAAFRRFGPRLIDLSYANPFEGPPRAVLDVLARTATHIAGRSLQYTPAAGRSATRRAVAASLGRVYGMPFCWRDVMMTAGAMPALNAVARALFEGGDEVIVLTPAWQDYPVYLRNVGVTVRFVPLAPDKTLDLAAIAGAIGPATRGILLSQPCCPTGVLYSREDVDGLSTVIADAEAAFGTPIYVISDEVHRHLVWSGRPFHSALQTHPRTISIYSFGKALSLQGARIGYLALSPRMPDKVTVRTCLERSLRVMGSGGPATLMQYAICDLLEYEPDLAALAARQTHVRAALGACGYEVCEGNATFYVYVKSPLADDFRFAELLASAGVLVAPSTLFHEAGYIRLSLTAQRERIVAAMPVFERLANGQVAAVPA